jgi:Carboxypeptidase regulatory-like domain/TonB dependent receptor/TonB-dependent Receptor Plug Domain
MRNVSLIVLATLYCVTSPAQFQFGSVVGLIKDASQAAVPGATIEIRSQSTNVARQAVSSTAGEYNFVSLPPDKYTITVKHPGFRDTSRALELSVGQRLEADITLEVGGVTEEVTVKAETPLLEVASSELGNVRSEKQVEDLPLNTRNFTQLVALAPGVNNRGGSSNSILQGYTSGRGVNGAVINGAPSEGVVYMFDGVQSVDNDAGMVIFFPPVDAIQEFKVQTSAAPAAYGGGAGVINVDFKSGTNSLHGAGYEFLRNSAFDARNFFDSHANPIPPFRLNQFGFNIGGPVFIPKVFNGKDKLFFFADYEGKRVFQAQTFTSTVPIPAFHTGDFSSLLPKTVIFDPRGNGHTPLPNNIIPLSAIDPTSARLMALYPAQNLPGITSNYLYNPGQQTRVNQYDIRVDYRTGASTFFARLSRENPDTVTPGFLPAPAIGGGPSRPGHTLVPAWQGVIGYGRVISPHVYYEARLGFSRMVEYINDADIGSKTLAESLGIPNANSGGAAGGLTNISISGTVGLGDGSGSLAKVNNDYQYSQALSWVYRGHELKFGGDIMSRRFSFFSPTYPVGQMVFSGVYSGYGLSDFLFGHPISSTIDITKFFSLHRFINGFYVQDTWRVTPKVTLNYGLRDDIVTPWIERHNQLAGFVPTGGGTLVPVGTAPYSGNSVTDGRYTNFGPRAGVAYTVTPKTVIRAGFGIFYSFAMQTSNLSPAKNPPFSGSLQASNNASDFVSALPISAGFPAARPALYPIAGLAWVYFPRDFKTSGASEWNFNVQRELFANTVLTLAYVGMKGTHVLVTDNINEALPGPGAVAPRRPYPNLGDGTAVADWGDSSYHSMQTTVQRRFSSGFSMLAAWTWAHSIDNSSGTGSDTVQTPYNLHLNRGNSSFDLRHNVVLSWTYELPFAKGKSGPLKWIVGGWQLNSIDSFQSGTPFTPTMQSSLLNAGSGVQWPNRIASGRLDNPTIARWFDPTAFVSPGNYVYGNSARNILVGPRTTQFDVSLFKSFSFSADNVRRVQFRAEAFNLLNTPQFNNPNASIGNLAVGQITSAGQPPLFQRTSREIQLALKLYW